MGLFLNQKSLLKGNGPAGPWSGYTEFLSRANYETNTGSSLIQLVNTQDVSNVTFGVSPAINSIADKSASNNALTATAGCNLINLAGRNMVQFTGTGYLYNDAVAAAYTNDFLNKPHYIAGLFYVPSNPASTQTFMGYGDASFNIYQHLELTSSGGVVARWGNANGAGTTSLTSTATVPLNRLFLLLKLYNRNDLRIFLHDGITNNFVLILDMLGGLDREFLGSRFAIGARYVQGGVSQHATNIRYGGHMCRAVGVSQNPIKILEQAATLFNIPRPTTITFNAFPVPVADHVFKSSIGTSPDNKVIETVASTQKPTPVGTVEIAAETLPDGAGGFINSAVIDGTDGYCIGVVEAAHNIANKTDFTVMIRHRPAASASTQTILAAMSAASTGWQIGHVAGKYRYTVNGSLVAECPDNITDNQWNLLFVYRSGGNVFLRAYIYNGTTTTISTANGAHVASNMLGEELIFGGRWLTATTAQEIFNGRKGRATFYDSAFTTTQMDNMWNNGSFRSTPIDAISWS